MSLSLSLECAGLVHEIYSTGVPSAYVHCMVSFCIDVTPYTRSANCLLALLHLSWQAGTSLDNEHFYTSNVFPYK